MAKDFKAILHKGTARAENFMEVFGRLEVCIESPLPVMVNVPQFDEPQAAYMLDLKLITEEEMDRLVKNLVRRFNLDRDDARTLIKELGVPILADDCTVVIDNPHKWLT